MTSAQTPKTIDLYGYGNQHEAVALAAITPGMLVERAPGGVRAHGTAGGFAAPYFANEYGLTGLTIDDAYAAGDQVIFTAYTNGSGVYALLAAGQTVAEGGLLVSAGNGALAPIGAAGGVVVGIARDAVDNSGGTETVRVRVEVVPGVYVPAE